VATYLATEGAATRAALGEAAADLLLDPLSPFGAAANSTFAQNRGPIGTPESPLYWGPALPNGIAPTGTGRTQQIVKSDNVPLTGRPDLSTFELRHDGSLEYIFHLTTGPNSANPAAILGIGLDGGSGLGIFINNKAAGRGLIITQNDTVISATAYELLMNTGRGLAPGAYILQDPGTGATSHQTAMIFHAFQAINASQKLVEFRRPNGTSAGAMAAWVCPQDGALLWESAVLPSPLDVATVPLAVTAQAGQMAALTTWTVLGGAGQVASVARDGTITGSVFRAQTAAANFELYDTAGTAGQRRYRVANSTGFLTLQARNDDGSSACDLMFLKHSDRSLGLFGSLGFGGGQGVMALGNAIVIRSSNPACGGALYVEAGALQYRGSAGTVTTIAAA
jgi:hypothetical protein